MTVRWRMTRSLSTRAIFSPLRNPEPAKSRAERPDHREEVLLGCDTRQ